MTAVIEVCAAIGLVVAEIKTVTMYMRSDMVEVEAAGQRYKQGESLFYLFGKVSSIGGVFPEVHSRFGQDWACFDK